MKINVFDKPRAKPNLFELCRGEKWSMKMNVFVKPDEQSRTRAGYAMARKRLLKTNERFH